MKNLNHIKIYLSILILWGMKRLNNSNRKKKVIGFTLAFSHAQYSAVLFMGNYSCWS